MIEIRQPYAKNMKTLFNVSNICLVCFLSVAFLSEASISKGHRILLNKGLQVQATVFPQNGFTLSRWEESNFTTVLFPWEENTNVSLLGTAPGRPWGCWRKDILQDPNAAIGPTSAEKPYLSNLVSVQHFDEQKLTDWYLTQAIRWFGAAKLQWPDAILHTNQWDGANNSLMTSAELRAYMQACKPDMLCFDAYPFGLNAVSNPIGGSPVYFYEPAAKYRILALEGNDGTGSEPIPFGTYTQSFCGSYWVRHPSPSELSLHQFAAWTFGAKWVNSFVYTTPYADNPTFGSFFSSAGDSQPTALFYEIKEINRQSRNLGPALVRLISTDVRFLPGQHLRVEGEPYENGQWIIYNGQWRYLITNKVPAGVSVWNSAADPYLKTITASNLGTLNDGFRGDVLIGFFKPLHPLVVDKDWQHANWQNERYFMITNGLSDKSGSRLDTQQSIRLDFDFGSSGITRLLRLSRETGEVETLNLIHNGDTKYYIVLTLPGGTGDLFKYDTGIPFVLNEKPDFFQDTFEYDYNQNAGGQQMTANGWFQVGTGTSGAVVNYGGQIAPSYALWSNQSKAGLHFTDATFVQAEFALWARIPKSGSSLPSPANQGIVIELKHSASNAGAVFRFAADFLFTGSNSQYSSGFQFVDGLDTFSAITNDHMVTLGYQPDKPIRAKILYDSINHIVSMMYNDVVLFQETLRSKYIFDTILFSSAYLTNKGTFPTATNAPWVIDNLVITTGGQPICENVIFSGMKMASDITGPQQTPDCRVDIYDLAALAQNWLNTYDMDFFSTLSSQWLECNDPLSANCQ